MCPHAEMPFPKVHYHAAEGQVEEPFWTLSDVQHLWASTALRNDHLVLEKGLALGYNHSSLVSVTQTGFSDCSAASGRRLNGFCSNLKLPVGEERY